MAQGVLGLGGLGSQFVFILVLQRLLIKTMHNSLLFSELISLNASY